MRDLIVFLQYGYLPFQREYTPRFINIRSLENKIFQWPDANYPEEGKRILESLIPKQLSAGDMNKLHVVPLSGGLDSRAILAGLLRSVPPENIIALTYGTPGTWDYEIGILVAKHLGVKSLAINLVTQNWKSMGKDLQDYASAIPQPVPIYEAYVNHYVAQQVGHDSVIWSGYLGEALSGAHLRVTESDSWEKARVEFAHWNTLPAAVEITRHLLTPEEILPTQPFLPKETLSYDDQLDLGCRQSYYIEPIVFPSGFDYRAPFRDPEWQSYMIGAPKSERKSQILYKKILTDLYPEIFSLPTKTNFGLPLNASKWQRRALLLKQRCRKAINLTPLSRFLPPDPGTNYIDFRKHFYNNGSFSKWVQDHVMSFSEHGVFSKLELEIMWTRRFSAPHLLLRVAQAEVLCRAGKFIQDAQESPFPQ